MTPHRLLTLSILLAGTFSLSPIRAADADKTPVVAAPAAAPKSTPTLALGEPAPEIDAASLDNKPLTLASLAGKPIVLQFASLTDPIFRERVPDSEKLAAKYADKATFLIIYQREAHPADGADALAVNVDAGYAITKPVNESDRVKLAQQTIDRLKIAHQQIAVDAWSDASSLRYGSYPNMTFVIDAAGKLQAGYPWMDPAKVTGTLNALLAGKPVPAEFQGKTKTSAPADFDYVTEAQQMGGRGANLGLLLDRMTLTPEQKAALFPPLSAYLAEARDFREKHAGGLTPNRPAAPPTPAAANRPGAAVANPAPKPAGTPPDDGVKTESPEDLQKAIESLRATAQKLKTAVNQTLPEKDAKQVLDTLEQGPAKRLFAD